MLVDLALNVTTPFAVPLCSQDALDRTVLPIPEPQPPVITELDARNVKAPSPFKVTAPKSAPNVVIDLLASRLTL